MNIGKATSRAIRRRSTPHVIVRFDRDQTVYDQETGYAYSVKEEDTYIQAYITQPVVNVTNDGPEAQRTLDKKIGWSLDLIRNKDKIILREQVTAEEFKDVIYTVSDLKHYLDGDHREFMLTRSGERDNIAT